MEHFTRHARDMCPGSFPEGDREPAVTLRENNKAGNSFQKAKLQWVIKDFRNATIAPSSMSAGTLQLEHNLTLAAKTGSGTKIRAMFDKNISYSNRNDVNRDEVDEDDEDLAYFDDDDDDDDDLLICESNYDAREKGQEPHMIPQILTSFLKS
ncbi:hypothetical protein Ancab_024435 [Ancistrocladus abbreviatus]